eukprot:TRINITY_DN10463_c1_g2_i1.p1 TRINITY_DN10463_c1_g2~~TRINITY_DN10463_c1_g2_i1.p1  ORF type:complete len:759 (+),score=200.31 TRINITY_DN10463_c1_g2_i1:112-2388(+)
MAGYPQQQQAWGAWGSAPQPQSYGYGGGSSWDGSRAPQRQPPPVSSAAPSGKGWAGKGGGGGAPCSSACPTEDPWSQGRSQPPPQQQRPRGGWGGGGGRSGGCPEPAANGWSSGPGAAQQGGGGGRGWHDAPSSMGPPAGPSSGWGGGSANHWQQGPSGGRGAMQQHSGGRAEPVGRGAPDRSGGRGDGGPPAGRGGGGGKGRGSGGGGGGRGRSSGGGRGSGGAPRGRGGGIIDQDVMDVDDDDDDADEVDYDGDCAMAVMPASPGKGGKGMKGRKGHPSAPAPSGPGIKSSGVKFSSIPGISPGTRRAINEVLKYEWLTPVQNETLPLIMQGGDVIAKAKTGTGKTCAFLLPTVERLTSGGSVRGCVGCLVLSPTRELARQTATESEKLFTFHRGMRTVCVVGGTNMKTEQRQLADAPAVLVATPGRLQDHLENTAGVSGMLGRVGVLVLDECDQLVDLGFWPAIERIIGYLPPPGQRQTLLFSATLNPRVRKTARVTLSPRFSEVDCVGEEVATADNVPQRVAFADLDTQIETLLAEITNATAEPGYKIMAFFTTARLTQWFAELFQKMGWGVLEIHSRKSQGHREKTSQYFRQNVNVIMFSSDVSARGMDYPDVTDVIQVGAPSSREQYVHRLGRTARAGKHGACFLLLCPWEEFFMRHLKDLPVTRCELSPTAEQYAAVRQGKRQMSRQSSSQAYQAWLGYYNSCPGLRFSKPELVQMANYWAQVMGCPSTPALQKKTVGKMGLKGVPGLVVE